MTRACLRKRAAGFTLVELLVVIAIIAVLMALGLRALGKVRVARNQMESASRLRQWGAALGAYLADNNGELPRRGQGVQAVTQLDRPEDWFNALPTYLGELGYGQLVKTQKRPHAGQRSIFVRPGAEDPGGVAFLSYAMNMNLSPWNLPGPTRIAAIQRTAATVFLAESPGPYASTYPSAKPYGCVADFNGRGNLLFLDGHVSAFEAAYIGVGKGDPQREDVRWLTGTDSDAQASNY